jgi:hypothetical protein
MYTQFQLAVPAFMTRLMMSQPDVTLLVLVLILFLDYHLYGEEGQIHFIQTNIIVSIRMSCDLEFDLFIL